MSFHLEFLRLFSKLHENSLREGTGNLFGPSREFSGLDQGIMPADQGLVFRWAAAFDPCFRFRSDPRPEALWRIHFPDTAFGHEVRSRRDTKEGEHDNSLPGVNAHIWLANAEYWVFVVICASL